MAKAKAKAKRKAKIRPASPRTAKAKGDGGARRSFQPYSQIGEEQRVHIDLVREIEAKRGRNLICYFGSSRRAEGTITQDDATAIENLLGYLALNDYDCKLDILLQSRGGSATAAERIILTCRNFCSDFEVIVANFAMSAATLIAMGSDRITMSNTAVLGPIDPQMVYDTGSGRVVRSATSVVNAYQELIEETQKAIIAKQPPQPYLQLLNKMEPSWVQECKLARSLGKGIACEHLALHMLKSKTKRQVAQVVEHFLEEGEKHTHGRPISAAKASEFGLEVEIIPHDDDLWKLIWELFMRCETHVDNQRLAKYFVCRRNTLLVK